MSVEHLPQQEPKLFTEKDIPFYPTEEYSRFTVKFFETDKGMTMRIEPKPQYADMYKTMFPAKGLLEIQQRLKNKTFKDYAEASSALSDILAKEFSRQEDLQRNQVDSQGKSYTIENKNR